MTVKVGTFSVTDDKILVHVGSKDITVVGHKEGYIDLDTVKLHDAFEDYVNMFMGSDQMEGVESLVDFTKFLLIQTKLKDLVNREVCRRDNYYHVFLYNMKTLEVSEVEVRKVTKVLLTQEEIKQTIQELEDENTNFKELLEAGYKVAYMTNKKLDWFFNTEDVCNVANYHKSLNLKTTSR